MSAPQQLAPPTNALALAGFVLGLVTAGLTFLNLIIVLLFVPGLLAIIFGFIGINTANRLGGKRRGFAIAAVVLGFSPLWLPLLFVAITGQIL